MADVDIDNKWVFFFIVISFLEQVVFVMKNNNNKNKVVTQTKLKDNKFQKKKRVLRA